MDLPEMNEVFDVLFNNITSNMAPGLDSYEKSVFLTKALDEILKAYFNPKNNKIFEGYDDSLKRDIDFSMITVIKRYLVETPCTGAHVDPGYVIDEDVEEDAEKGLTYRRNVNDNISQASMIDVDYLTHSNFLLHSNAAKAVLPDNIMFMLDEQLIVSRPTAEKNQDGTRVTANTVLLVIPLAYSEFTRLMLKPYKRPLRNQAWRLTNCEGNEHSIDIVPSAGDVIQAYVVRYVKRPKPIILEDLDGVEIDGEWQHSECELSPIIHQDIVLRAVELAKAAFEGSLGSTVQIGNLSSTDKGIISTGDSKK